MHLLIKDQPCHAKDWLLSQSSHVDAIAHPVSVVPRHPPRVADNQRALWSSLSSGLGTQPAQMAWFPMELPLALAAITLLVLGTPQASLAAVWVPLYFWLIHYTYRTVDLCGAHAPFRTFPIALVLALSLSIYSTALTPKSITAQVHNNPRVARRQLLDWFRVLLLLGS